MKTAREHLEAKLDDVAAQAREVMAAASKDGRAMTAEERDEVKARLAQADEIRTELKGLEDDDALRKDVSGLRPDDRGPRSIGEAFVKSDEYKALVKKGIRGSWTTGAFELPGLKAWGAKALGDIGTGETISHGDSVVAEPELLGRIVGPAEWPLTIADLFTPGVTAATSVRYLEETVTTNAASGTAEGGTKPPSYLEFEKVDEPVKKITTFLPLSDEMMEDEPVLVSYINGRLELFVRQEEETQLLNGTGTDNVEGVMQRSGVGAAVAADIGGSNDFDAVMAGITDVRSDGGLEPDAMVVHPIDAAKMAIAKASTSGNYFSGGPYVAPAQNPWGLKAVITSRIAQGSILVGAFAEGAQLFRKGGLVVEASNSHSDWFQKNLTAVRAEERVALAVYRPAAFSVVTLGS